MAKPICVIYIDESVLPAKTADEVWELCGKLCDGYTEMMPDYHVFVIPDFNKEEPIPVFDCKVFYEKDFTEVQYQELKEIIESGLKNAPKPQ